MPDLSPSRKLIGEILVQRNIINQKQLNEALRIQKNEDEYLGEILIRLGYLNEYDIVVALITQCGLPYIAVNKYNIDEKIVRMIPAEIARKYHIVPLDHIGNILSVVMENPLSQPVLSELEKLTKCKIVAFISTRKEIDQAISHCY